MAATRNFSATTARPARPARTALTLAAPRALRPDLVQVALGSPRELLRKIRAGDALTEEERALLPKNYRSRPDAFDDFADRVLGLAHLFAATTSPTFTTRTSPRNK